MSDIDHQKCASPECESTDLYAKGLCSSHYRMQLRYGRTTRVKRKKGTGAKDGYIMKYQNDKCIGLHQIITKGVITSKHRGGFEVHHLDGDKHNNSRDNLVVCPDHSYHMLLHVREKLLNYIDAPDDTGVYEKKEVLNNKWQARVYYRRKVYHIGYFATKHEAVLARVKAAKSIIRHGYLNA